MIPAYLSLGSNLGDRRTLLGRGVASIQHLPAVELQAVSSLYEASPVGGPFGQPPYLNTVVRVRSGLVPQEMLRACLEIEDALGRVRGERWGPRTLDIDILTWGDLALETYDLVIPHPRLYERLFVLAPLLEIGVVEGGGVDENRAVSASEEIRLRGDQAVEAVEDPGWWIGAAPV